ncbi:hypothetical protein PR048_008773 [Dryococelus australis]|uniref:Uncharacterized protein n=1 Tax=Dryococelus australis TaxID=614101 RepID=A0ABQ9HY19_9NEOP|nr:hypothetical protein PR048_008773 [Dryococelus australis]
MCENKTHLKRAISTLASHQGEPGSIPGRVTGFSQVGIVSDDAVGRRVFSGISRFPAPSFRRRSIITLNTLTGSRDLAVKSRPNLFSHRLDTCETIIRTCTEICFRFSNNKIIVSPLKVPSVHAEGREQLGAGTRHAGSAWLRACVVAGAVGECGDPGRVGGWVRDLDTQVREPSCRAGSDVTASHVRAGSVDSDLASHHCSIVSSLSLTLTRSEYLAAPECKAGKREIPEETHRQAASSRTIPNSENSGATSPRIEPIYPLWEASTLAGALPQPPRSTSVLYTLAFHANSPLLHYTIVHGEDIDLKFLPHFSTPRKLQTCYSQGSDANTATMTSSLKQFACVVHLAHDSLVAFSEWNRQYYEEFNETSLTLEAFILSVCSAHISKAIISSFSTFLRPPEKPYVFTLSVRSGKTTKAFVEFVFPHVGELPKQAESLINMDKQGVFPRPEGGLFQYANAKAQTIADVILQSQKNILLWATRMILRPNKQVTTAPQPPPPPPGNIVVLANQQNNIDSRKLNAGPPASRRVRQKTGQLNYVAYSIFGHPR